MIGDLWIGRTTEEDIATATFSCGSVGDIWVEREVLPELTVEQIVTQFDEAHDDVTWLSVGTQFRPGTKTEYRVHMKVKRNKESEMIAVHGADDLVAALFEAKHRCEFSIEHGGK